MGIQYQRTVAGEVHPGAYPSGRRLRSVTARRRLLQSDDDLRVVFAAFPNVVIQFGLIAK